jgi:hypothetical protein
MRMRVGARHVSVTDDVRDETLTYYTTALVSLAHGCRVFNRSVGQQRSGGPWSPALATAPSPQVPGLA